MTPPDFDQPQLLALIAEVLDGSLDDVGREALNDMLRTSPEARRFFRGHLEMHARLHLDYSAGEVTEFLPGPSGRRKPSRFANLQWAVVAAAACIALMAALLWPRQPATDKFATLVSSSAARWNGSDLLTKDGGRLGKGTLRLAEGLATLRFDSGARLSLEAPVEVTLIDAMHCTLSNGIAVVEVPDSAHGFRVATPSADVVDYGTRFTVRVDAAAGQTHTHVYEGHVEIQHSSSGRVVLVNAGQMNSADKDNIGEAREWSGETTWPATIGPAMRGPEWTLLETVKDAYIGDATEKGVAVPRSKTLLLVKKSLSGYADRKAYLGFDLAGIDPRTIEDAELKLHFEPTYLGLATDVPDATFSVYGLLADDAWNENSINHKNAPANRFKASPNPHKTRKLGSFVIKQGVQYGPFGIRGEPLAEFLREHAKSTVTLIVVRDTVETQHTGLVHGFASRRHPTLPPPTLAIRRATPAK